MTLGPYTLDIYRGENKTYLLSVLDANRDPLNLTDCVLTLTVCFEACNTTILTKSSDDPTEIEILSPPNDGKANIYFIPSDTEDVKSSGNIIYHVWIELPSGEKQVVVEPCCLNVK